MARWIISKERKTFSNNVEYFPHKCKDDKELRYIQYKYKSKGFEVFLGLQQSLGDADNHFIDLSDDLQKYVLYVCNQRI